MRGERVRVASGLLLGHGGLLGLVGGEGSGEGGEFVGAGVADARELGVDAGLDFELFVVGAGAVGLADCLLVGVAIGCILGVVVGNGYLRI